MGTFHLENYHTKEYLAFLTRSGFVDEYDFWSSLSSISTGSVFDHMIDYLRSEGYNGTGHDMLRDFLQAQVGGVGTVGDMANVFFEGSFTGSPGVSDGLTTESGDPLTTEGGDQLFTEGD